MTRQWMEQVMPDGRKYLYNPDTGERVWDDASDTRRGSSSQNTWVEMTSQATGKKYYYNTLTKESVWELPNNNKGTVTNDKPLNSSADAGNEKEREHREQVFMRLLLEKNVGLDWTWERTLKEIISHPDYRAIPTLAERKALWETYIQDLKSTSTQVYLQMRQKCQKDFFAFLDSYDIPKDANYFDLKSSLLELSEFTQIRDAYPLKDSDFAQIFTEWCETLDKRRNSVHKERRQQAKEYLQNLLKALNISEASRWADFKDLLFSDSQINEYLCERVLLPKDVLYAFDDEVDSICSKEASPSNVIDEGKVEEGKKASSLLVQVRNLITQVIGVESDWPRVWKRLENHPLLDEILPLLQSPSQILKVYWEALDENQKLYSKERPIIEALARKRARHGELASEGNFIDFCKRKEDVSSFSCSIYFQQHLQPRPSERRSQVKNDEILKMIEDPEIQRKRLIELFKYSLKHHYDPPIVIGSKWEDYVEKIQSSSEYLQLPDKSLARHYFEKYQKYLAKKLPSGDSSTPAGTPVSRETLLETLEDGEYIANDVKRVRY